MSVDKEGEQLGRVLQVWRRESGKREKSKMGQKEQGRLPGRGVAGIRQGGICPKEESSWMSYWAEFEKDR